MKEFKDLKIAVAGTGDMLGFRWLCCWHSTIG